MWIKNIGTIGAVAFVIWCGEGFGQFPLTWVLAEPIKASTEARDPFIPLVHFNKPGQQSKNLEHANPLDAAPKVLGIVYGKTGYRALLQQSDGTSIMVSPGSVLPNGYARVVRILDEAVVLQTLSGPDRLVPGPLQILNIREVQGKRENGRQ